MTITPLPGEEKRNKEKIFPGICWIVKAQHSKRFRIDIIICQQWPEYLQRKIYGKIY